MTRIEGHAKLVLITDEEGMIEDASFLSTTLVRGFEYIVRGRSPDFAIKVVQRICGICPIPHGLASVEAIEQAVGATISPEAQRLRELLLISDKLHSHALHQYLLVEDLPFSVTKLQDVRKRMQTLRYAAQQIADIVGGEAIHPSNIAVGGMKEQISSRAAALMYRSMRSCEHLVTEHRHDIAEGIGEWNDLSKYDVVGYEGPMLASDIYYGNRDAIDTSAISEISPYRFYDKSNDASASTATIPLYFGEPVEVGSRARLSIFKGFHSKTPLDINIARAREMAIYVFRALELLDELKESRSVNTKVTLKKGSGLGVIEAPRGTNMHDVSLNDDGLITDYNIIAPTTWNMPTIERALIGNHQSVAGMIVRSFDPCIDCATHCLEIRDLEGKIKEKRRII